MHAFPPLARLKIPPFLFENKELPGLSRNHFRVITRMRDIQMLDATHDDENR